MSTSLQGRIDENVAADVSQETRIKALEDRVASLSTAIASADPAAGQALAKVLNDFHKRVFGENFPGYVEPVTSSETAPQ